MGLRLEISLDKDIRDLNTFFDDLKFKAVVLAARQGLNRAAKRTRSLAIKEIRKRRKLKLKEFKGRITMKKATGVNLDKLEARVNFSGIPLPMILFILGQKSPKAQTMANPRRKSRRFEVSKGLKKPKPGLFIQKAQRGKMQFQVFRRGNPNIVSEGFKLQTTPGIAEFLRSKSNILRKIENSAIALMQQEYDQALSFQLSKLRL